jgi:RNA 3'-terminal phosphate cyclase-like protein
MPAPTASSDILRYTTHHNLRHRLTLAVLSGRSIRVDNIRSDDVHVGLRDYEISFLRLIEKITNGTTIEIGLTGKGISAESKLMSGTSLLLHPGLLAGGTYHHACHLGRPIGYYLEPLIPLGPFGKKPLQLTLEGITGQEGQDMTADMIRTVTLPHLHLFGITEGLELQVSQHAGHR